MTCLNRRTALYGGAFGVTFACMAAPSANLILNGSFETAAVDPGAGFVLYNAGSAGIMDWLVTAGNVHHVGTYWEAQDGSRSVDLNGNTAGGIQQAFPTQIGHDYEVSFFLAGNPDGAPLEKLLQASAAGMFVDFSFDVSGQSRPDMGYETRRFLFVADATVTTLAFNSSVAGEFGAVIDNIVVVERSVSPD